MWAGPQVFGDEIGVLPHAIAGALYLDHDGMVEQAIEESCGNDGVTENLAPFGKASIGGKDHGALFVAGIDELEEQVSAPRGHRKIADLIDDKQ